MNTYYRSTPCTNLFTKFGIQLLKELYYLAAFPKYDTRLMCMSKVFKFVKVHYIKRGPFLHEKAHLLYMTLSKNSDILETQNDEKLIETMD